MSSISEFMQVPQQIFVQSLSKDRKQHKMSDINDDDDMDVMSQGTAGNYESEERKYETAGNQIIIQGGGQIGAT